MNFPSVVGFHWHRSAIRLVKASSHLCTWMYGMQVLQEQKSAAAQMSPSLAHSERLLNFVKGHAF